MFTDVLLGLKVQYSYISIALSRGLHYEVRKTPYSQKNLTHLLYIYIFAVILDH